MKSLHILIALLVATLLGPALHAQSPLDRVDPTQEEEIERREEVKPDTELKVEVEDAPSRLETDAVYEVGAIVIEGGLVLGTSDFLDIIDDYSARTLGEEQLAELVDRIARRAREHGYIFATAWIEPQSLDSGVLRVRLDEGVIDRIRVEGTEDPAILAQLEPLKNGWPVTLRRLERHVLLADDISGVYIRRTRFEHEDGEGVLVVDARRSYYAGRIEFENDGSRPVGPERLRIDLDANGLLTSFDEIDLTYSTAAFQPSELQYGRLRYRTVVNRSGVEVGAVLSYSSTEPGAFLEDRDILGESYRIGATVSVPLRRSRAFSLWLEGEAEFRELRNERDSILDRRDRIPVVRAGLYSRAEVAGGYLRGSLTVSQGLDILGATEKGDPLASRDDASARFTSLYGWMSWKGPLTGDFSLELAARGQLSTDPLLITEDIGLGGTRYLRAYNFNERSGDQGIMGYAELQYDIDEPLNLIHELQVYAYVDGGIVDELEDGHRGGSLASAGGGFRAEITRDLDFDLEVAAPLTGPRFDTDDKSPQLNLRLSYSF